ncbi:sodium- and chloride-dependent glycine transporter 2 [Lingula anatina]|uniref:Transporter n=1 Tax=Lingula anatina TaxID=7574 RepID=A0A1S3H4X7_LINAN|nr:sodium- and chloride-dependent glycine transporter 2 [Lingula anatina]|eukprot:XP_013381022.1 sodium- and chloride-dependent glycine transporter 2 [Lingula anatina]
MAVVQTEETEAEDGRATWGGKFEFILTCVGYAVGLGNVWRFPYLTFRNGGGAFLLPYIIMLVFVGLPLFFLELAFGQFASLGPITIWRINILFKGLGFAMVSVSWMIGLYYNVVISHVLVFLISSMTAELPWTTCRKYWNTPSCVEDPKNKTALAIAVNFTGRSTTPSEEYYDNFVLEVTSGIDEPGGMNWRVPVALFVAWVIVLLCLLKGIQTLGKVAYFTAIFPYIMLTILLVRGLTLDGAVDGITFYLKPDFSKLADSRVWSDAATQIFFSLSACSGGLIAMSSYNDFKNNCLRDSIIVATINCATSVYAGFVIFSVLGNIAYNKGVLVEDVVAGGPGLAFVAYPEAIARMPLSPLWAILFFIMMATLGFGSQLSTVECVLSALTDEYADWLRPRKNNIIFRAVFCFVCFLLGLPMATRGGIYMLNLLDYSVSGFPLLVVGFTEVVVLNWIYGYDQFSTDIEMMLGRKPNIYWKVCWIVLTPVIIFVTIIFNFVLYKNPTYNTYQYPGWAVALGWLISLWPTLMIPVWWMYRFCKDGGWEFTKEVMRPLPDWGPASEGLRKEYYGQMEAGEENLGYSSSSLWSRPQTGGSISTLGQGSTAAPSTAASTLSDMKRSETSV